MTPRAEAILRRQFELFREKFGRDPGPGDPVFFDPSKDEPAHFSEGNAEEKVVEAMRKAGIKPQIIYTPASKADWKEWYAAIEEFELERKAGRDSDAS